MTSIEPVIYARLLFTGLKSIDELFLEVIPFTRVRFNLQLILVAGEVGGRIFRFDMGVLAVVLACCIILIFIFYRFSVYKYVGLKMLLSYKL